MEDVLLANGRKGIGKGTFKVDDDGISTSEVIGNALEKVFHALRLNKGAHSTVKQHVTCEEKGESVVFILTCTGKKKE